MKISASCQLVDFLPLIIPVWLTGQQNVDAGPPPIAVVVQLIDMII